MSTTALPTVTRKELPSGKFRYEADGVVVTAKSARLYTAASVYREILVQVGSEPCTVTRPTATRQDRELVAKYGATYEATRPIYGPVPEAEQTPIVFLHARADLAAKGSPDANRLVEQGKWARVPGFAEIVEA